MVPTGTYRHLEKQLKMEEQMALVASLNLIECNLMNSSKKLMLLLLLFHAIKAFALSTPSQSRL